MDQSNEITELLIAWKDGNNNSLEKLIPLVEAELRRIARRQVRRERDNHTLQTTALINEAYLKLANASGIAWQNRAHFFAVSANIMRRILINYARDARTQKRGDSAEHINIDDVVIFSIEKSNELIALDEALNNLSELDKIKSQIVEMRYFGGMTIEETAEALDISPSSVSLHWRMARAWLQEQLR
jgi:RNA polymerase sigma factor (TIGR02999 family)